MEKKINKSQVLDGYRIIRNYAYSAAGGGQGTKTMPLNAWSHIALVRHGEYFTLFVNGEKSVEANIGSTSMYIYSQFDWSILLGIWDDTRSYGSYINFDEIRIIDKAVWTDDFTPPTVPYTN